MPFFGISSGGSRSKSILCLDKQDGNVDFVADGVGGGAQEEVGEKAMAMG